MSQLRIERQSALEAVERLTKTLEERDLTIRNQNERFDAEVEKNLRMFGLAECHHLEERERHAAEVGAGACVMTSSRRT